MADQILIDRTREHLRVRLGRAQRRYSELMQSLQAADLAAAHDDLVAILSKFKSIQFQFCGLCNQSGLQGQGYNRIKGWRDTRLGVDHRKAWDEASALRNFDIHAEPLPQPQTLTGELTLWTATSHLVLQSTDVVLYSPDTGSRISLRPFCNGVITALVMLVEEFNQLV
jgi:hypothetical protein